MLLLQLQLTLLPQRCLPLHNIWSFSLSPYSLKSAFHVISRLQASFGLQVAQYPNISDAFCLKATHGNIGWIMLLYWPHCQFAVFASWQCWKAIFGILTIVVCVDFVVERDVEYCKIWIIWRHAAAFMSRLVDLMILNNAKPACWMSIKWE